MGKVGDFQKESIKNKKEGLNYQHFIDLKGNFYYSSNENMVHHKICIIDDNILITGSYNWTYYAENRNWENVVFLKDRKILEGYIKEYDKIIANHRKVESVENEKANQAIVSSNDYLLTDYQFQAKSEEDKGNELNVAKIYNAVLRIKPKQNDIINARNKIVEKYNTNQIEFEVSPFEIGILYKSGYRTVIPAFEKLPFSVVRGGKTTNDNQKGISITIQKFDGSIKNIWKSELKHIKPSPSGTEKIEHTLELNKAGILTINCKEKDGYNRIKKGVVDIKNWL